MNSYPDTRPRENTRKNADLRGKRDGMRQKKGYKMYTCAMDKQQYDGEPAFKNAAGSFCPECTKIIWERQRAGAEKRRSEMNGICIWCHEKITPQNSMTGKEDEHVCRECCRNRDWLLKCIRISERPAKYVSRVEEKEKPAREERELQKRNTQQEKEINIDTLPTEAEHRIKHLEEMMSKLIDALGV